MLVQFSFSQTDKQIQETVIDLGNWFLDDSDNNDHDKAKQHHFYSKSDSNKTLKTSITISNDQVLLNRNGSAEIPLFYFMSPRTIFVSDSVYELQQHIKQPLDLDTAYPFLYSQFLPKEKTLFLGIIQVLNEQAITFALKGSVIECRVADSFSLPMNEFDSLSEKQLTIGLREQIARAHSDRLSENNAIFLSGGLDSQVMAITLSKDLGLGQNLSSLHFSVKGARQSELVEAELTAQTLDIPFHAIEVDPQKEIDFEKLLKMNAPYIGAVSIHQLLESSNLTEGTTIFAGQDTRLHTPSIHSIDEKLLGLYSIFGFGSFISTTAKVMLALKNITNNEFESRLYRQLSFFDGTNSVQKYLANRFFHIANLPFQDKEKMEVLRSSIINELGDVKKSDKRALFNTLATLLWRRQFIYDINYMHDTISANNNKIAMPFYDTELAYYSAQLPFDLAAKMTKGRAGHGQNEVSVNKYLLRKAYEGELDDSLVFRDKAVCLTAHMFFNGGLQQELERFIDASWLAKHEIALSLHLPELQTLSKRKHNNWLESDHWLMMTIFNALIIYNYLRVPS